MYTYWLALYNGSESEHSVYSVVFDQSTGRPMLLSAAAIKGDMFRVTSQDIMAKPDVYLAPCGRPFLVTGGAIADPCLQQAVEPPPDLESLPEPPPPPDLTAEDAPVETVVPALEAAGFAKPELAERGLTPKPKPAGKKKGS